MLPYRIWDYPVPSFMPSTSPIDPDDWPAPMDPLVRRFDEATGHLPRTSTIYVHLPFCPFHCSFCGYYTRISKGPNQGYIDVLEREIRLYAGRVPAAQRFEYRHILFGGGTPSQHDAADLRRIVDALREVFPVPADAEITLEGIAEDLVRDRYLAECREAGFTRVAYGIQSLDERVRRVIGRGKEDVSAFPAVVRKAHEAGIVVNVELMMGCPEQTVETLKADLDEVVSWDPASIDVTAFVPIPGTNLHRRLVQGKFVEKPDEGLSYGGRLLGMRQLTTARLAAAGYRLARPECYTRGDRRFEMNCGPNVGNGLHAALAFGPSAHGHLDGTAYVNVSDLDAYTTAVEAGLLPIERAESLTAKSATRRALLDALSALFIPDPLITPRMTAIVARWEANGLVERAADDRGYALTERGFHWQNQLQIEALGRRDAAKGSQLVGSVEDHLTLIRNGSGIGTELLEQAGATSESRRAMYTAALENLTGTSG
jgi:oxygen-independent coproporphyrinogen-3 oxidase